MYTHTSEVPIVLQKYSVISTDTHTTSYNILYTVLKKTNMYVSILVPSGTVSYYEGVAIEQQNITLQ